MGKTSGDPYTFRVSDSVEVPLRGQMLRLRLTEGAPSMSDLAVGRVLHLTSPGGSTRELPILAHSVTGGNPTQKRLERVRELDVIVDGALAAGDGDPIEIGWLATGPVTS
ncbi:MAG: hypothetical protein ABIV28_06250 [Longimicrobiales bacterium]